MGAHTNTWDFTIHNMSWRLHDHMGNQMGSHRGRSQHVKLIVNLNGKFNGKSLVKSLRKSLWSMSLKKGHYPW